MLARCDEFVQFIERNKELDVFLILDCARQEIQALDQVVFFVILDDIYELYLLPVILIIIFKATTIAVP